MFLANNKNDFFKSLYLLLVLLFLDIVFFVIFIESAMGGDGLHGNIYQGVLGLFCINIGFIYVNFNFLKMIYKYIQKYGLKRLFNPKRIIFLIKRYKNRNKPKGISYLWRVFLVGFSLLGAAIWEGGTIQWIFLILIALYNLWRLL